MMWLQKKKEKKPKVEKTMTGKKTTEVKVDPELEEKHQETRQSRRVSCFTQYSQGLWIQPWALQITQL